MHSSVGRLSAQSGATLSILLCGILWSFGGLFVKVLLWNPLLISGGRSLVAAAVIYLFTRKTGVRLRFTKRAIYSGIFLAANGITCVLATKLTTAANAIVLQYTSPIFIMLICALFYRQRFSRGDILAVACALGGISMVFLDKLAGASLLGNLVGILSGISIAAFHVLSARTGDDEDRFGAIIAGHLITALVSVPVLFLDPPAVTAPALGALLFLGVFQQAAPFILYGFAIRRCSALTASLVSMSEPLLNPIWVLLVLGDRPGIWALCGGLFVITVVTVWCVSGQLSAKKKQKTAV